MMALSAKTPWGQEASASTLPTEKKAEVKICWSMAMASRYLAPRL